MFRIITLFHAIILVLPLPILADTINVPVDYPTIQMGIDAAMSGDTVLVAPGTYVENIHFNGIPITLMSSDGPEVTCIDGNKSGSVVIFNSNEMLDTILKGFCITNGSGTYIDPFYWGGGIYCDDSSPLISNCIIDNNSGSAGGGIGLSGSSAWIYECIIENNVIDGGIHCLALGNPIIQSNKICYNDEDGISMSCNGQIFQNIISDNIGYGIDIVGENNLLVDSNYISNNLFTGICIGYYCMVEVTNNLLIGNGSSTHGGAISCGKESKVKIINNVIKNNRTVYSGGGIYGFDYYNVAVVNCLIANNEADFGGGIYYYDSTQHTFQITNCTIIGNIASKDGGGVYGKSDYYPIIHNSIIWDNNAPEGPQLYPSIKVNYSDIQGGWPGYGNIDADPHFVDSKMSDFHIRFTSPCKDTGNNQAQYVPNFDCDGNQRICFGKIDMGVDEYYNYLYCTGKTLPKCGINVKIVGYPNCHTLLFMGTDVLVQPRPTMYGDWYLMGPLMTILPGTIPYHGIIDIPIRIPSTCPNPMDIPLQALIRDELSNLCVLEIK